MKTRTQQIEELQKEWTQPRWEGITRPYSAEDVVKLRGSVNLNARWRNWAQRKCGVCCTVSRKRLHQQPRRTDWRSGAATGESGY